MRMADGDRRAVEAGEAEEALELRLNR
jgi:hypothetical protein